MDDSKGIIRDYLGWFGSGYYYVIEGRNDESNKEITQKEVDNFMENASKELLTLFDEYKSGVINKDGLFKETK